MRVRHPNPLDERHDLVRMSDEGRADQLYDHGIVRVALGTDDDALGHGHRGVLPLTNWLSFSARRLRPSR